MADFPSLRTPTRYSNRVATRRSFIKKIAAGAATGLAISSQLPVSRAWAKEKESVPKDGRKVKYVGWMAGLTHQLDGGGIGRDAMMRLLDEMAENGMNILSLLMQANGFYNLHHDGFCWPIQNPKLKHNWDASSINGQPATEFVNEAILAAADRGIEIQMFTSWGQWNPKKITKGYPTATVRISRKGEQSAWTHCADSPGAWQAGLAEVADLLAYYDHPNVKSFAFETLRYGGPLCYCKYTQDAYHRDTGLSMLDANRDQLNAWKTKQISRYLKKFIEHIHSIRPELGVWLHTQCAPGTGHDPARLQACGIEYLLPYTLQRSLETKTQIQQKLQRLSPNPCVLHFDTRAKNLPKYTIATKTPETIARAIDGVLEYPGDNLAGLMFWNRITTPARNVKAVYEQIKRFDWGQA